MILSTYSVCISGSNCLRVINALENKNIPIFDVVFGKNLIFKIKQKHFKELESLTEIYGVNLLVQGQSGLDNLLKKIVVNLPYILACIICSVMLFISTQFVYHTQITCENSIYSNKVATLLKQNKIVGAVPKKSLNMKELEHLILTNINQVSFATCYIDGLTLKIHLIATDNPHIVEKQKNLTSNYDAIITRIVVRNGTSKVQCGERVKSGDILIGGFHIADNTPTDGTETGDIYECEADGEVYGKVYIQKRFFLPKQAVSYVRTGAFKTISDLGFGKAMLLSHKKTPYKHYEKMVNISKMYNILPFTIKNYTYYELKKVTIDQKTYVEQLKQEFNKQLINTLNSEAKILSKDYQIKIVDGVSYLDINYEIEQRIDNGGHNY